MHVTDQPMFLNAAIWVETPLNPHELLRAVKKVETTAGRDLGGRRWGPRPLDIDIIFQEGVNIATEELTIPHPRWQDRAFVCRPVLDLSTREAARLAWVCTLGGMHCT
jgi:2-amino-4-hydroxy-6-hydroxymethyldihydropteridine diphosphokinase